MKLTKRAIDAATYQGKDGRRDVRWDDEVPGFGVRIYPTGKKAFVLFYRASGRQRLMTLGSYGQYSVDQARKLARKHLVDIDNGIDPLEVRQKDTQGETLKELCSVYI
ncbi:MAG: Arm DNA-binding domain-containing protein, partial [Pseudomonadota bacterium]|nr:Arm DNA-binding domain-containing protein [Pseudomonadota bacterium]